MAVKVEDRRLFDRCMARFPTKFKESHNDYGAEVFLRDISAEGAKIQSRSHPLLNHPIELVIDLPDGHGPMVLAGRVVWVRNGLADGNWNAGVKFNRVNLMRTQRIYNLCQ